MPQNLVLGEERPLPRRASDPCSTTRSPSILDSVAIQSYGASAASEIAACPGDPSERP
jgi:hypothetical protein